MTRTLTPPVLEAIDHQEPPDTHPSKAQRRLLKTMACSLALQLSSRELVYLAGALEVEANLVRAMEEAGRR